MQQNPSEKPMNDSRRCEIWFILMQHSFLKPVQFTLNVRPPLLLSHNLGWPVQIYCLYFFSIFQSVCSSISIRQKCAIASGKIRATQAPCHHMNKWRSSVTHVCIQFNRLPHRRPLVMLSLLLALASWLTKSRASGNLRPIDNNFFM